LHNRAPYLAIRSHLLDAETLTGSDDFFLGHGSSAVNADQIQPSAALVHQHVVPALEEVLSPERSTRLREEALIALARLGAPDTERATVLVKRFVAVLHEGSQSLRESAVIALGVLRHPRALPELLALFRDDEQGRQMLRESEVPERVRSFAGYGLALLAESTRDSELRRAVSAAAMDVLEHERSSTYEVEVAALHALSFAALDLRLSRDGLRTVAVADHPDRRLLSRRSQVAWLLDFLRNPRRGDALPRPIQAQIPLALARLCEGVPDSLRETVCDTLLDALRPGKRPSAELRQGGVLALGLLGKAGDARTDARVRERLIEAVDKGDAGTRRLALIALGQIASRPGAGEEPLEGAREILALLRSTLSEGGSQLEPWAALSLGVYVDAWRERDGSVDEALKNELSERAALSRRPQDVGAYCIALGLARVTSSSRVVFSRLDSTGDPTARGHIALGLGLLGDRSAREALRGLLDHSLAQPELLRSVAVGLTLLDDKETVPRLNALLNAEGSQGRLGAVASALGLVGDGRAVEPLLALLQRESEPESTRALALQALGRVCESSLLPWEVPLSVDAHYMAATRTLTDGESGILDREW
jgi:HEAT repeat protein